MERGSGDSCSVEGSAAFARARSPKEVLEARRHGDVSKLVPAAKRLLRVLIADDYRDTADTMGFLVKLWGHDVRVAYDGASALEMDFAFQPDVLLLDIAMPKMNGFQVARQLRLQTRSKETLLGICSEERLRTLGAAAVLAKPFRLDEVAQVLRQLASNGQCESVQTGA